MRVLELFLAASALCTSVFSAALDDFESRPVFIPEWEVEVTPGGDKVRLNGTIQEVHQELLSLNPNWDKDFGLGDKVEAPSDETHGQLAKRTDFSNSKYFCGGRWEYCNGGAIAEGRAYLYRVPGRPTNGAGPGACGRVSCSYNAAIWWCNDEKTPKTLNSFGSIADGVYELEKHCRKYFSWNPSGVSIAGQIFHETNWNVIVRKDKC
ncbi:uncharacterized protein G6M90_00g054910 [Metarhizium brunneum]|uniref:Uncharacterized protein n=1 Tax=Metarhizium brunneum TaxID=500148 RepID=A0A7D5UYJ6_9HYPO|nr:hypothetical protein G6M90_00g054910 [Metarhizium brunneum]